jgi:hypothetical protein
MRRSACRFRESLAVCAVLRAWEPDTNGHAYQLFVWRDTPSGSTLRIVSEEATIGPDLGRLAVQSSQAQDRLACLASNAAPLRSKRWRGLGRHGPLLADTVEVLACVPVSRADHLAQRPPTCEEDHFPESLARAMIEAFSRPGDVVLDPFAGYGTTARVATRLGRQSIAVELLDERAAHIRDTTSDVVVVSGDARTLRTLVPGPVDLCLTWPPHMPSVGHPENPMTGYRTLDGNYDRYLDDLEQVFGQVAAILRPGAHTVVNVATIENAGHVTPLAFDVAARISCRLTFRGHIAICWDERPPGILSDHCLVFGAT